MHALVTCCIQRLLMVTLIVKSARAQRSVHCFNTSAKVGRRAQDMSLHLNTDENMVSEQTEEPRINKSQLACTTLSVINSVQNSNKSTERIALPMLYEDSSLSTESSLLVISSYMCRHHLTGQAHEDLLELIKLHLPKENNLPSSLYLARRASVQNNIVLNYHHYCQHCYTILHDCTSTLCPNEHCKTTINLETSPYLITISTYSRSVQHTYCYHASIPIMAHGHNS